MKTPYITILYVLLLSFSFSLYAGTGDNDPIKEKPVAIGYGSYKLINSVTDQEITNLVDGSEVNLALVGDQLNIRAIPQGGDLNPAVESVRFSSSQGSRTESAPPYAFKGDLEGDYYNWQPELGEVSFTVRYYSGNGASGDIEATDTFTITFINEVDTTPPAVPLLSGGTITDTSVELAWNTPVDAVEYRLYRDGVPVVPIAGQNGHTVMGLSPSTSYDFRLTALDALGNESAQSAPLSVATIATPDTTPPTAPSLSLITTGDNSISLSWNNDSDAVAYRLFTNGTDPIDLGNTNTHTVGNLQSDTPYSFSLIAIDLAGNQSTVSNQVGATTTVPSVLHGTYQLIDSRDNSVIGEILDGATYNLDIIGDSLNINALSTDATDKVRFISPDDNGHDRTEGAAPYAYFGDLMGDYYHWTPSVLDTPIAITVRYYDASGGLLEEDELTITFTDQADTDAPSTPTLSLVERTHNSIDLNWDASIDDRGIQAYELYQDNTLIKTVTVPGYLVTELNGNTNYTFSVRALDVSGIFSARSPDLQVTTLVAPDNTDPLPPTVLTLGTVTQNSVALSWGAATDNVGVTGYFLSINGGNATALGNSTSHTVGGLSPGTTYTFSISAVDAAGNLSTGNPSVTTTTANTSSLFATYNLIDAGDDTVIRTLSNGATISKSVVGNALNIDAVVQTGTAVQSVRFSSSDGHSLVENNAPYAYAYNNGNDFLPWDPPLGALDFTVEYFDGPSATGNPIATDTFTIIFVEGADTESPTSVRPSVVAATATTIELSWTPSMDNVGISHYRLFQNGSLIAEPGALETGFTSTGLQPDTQYDYVLRAQDASGNLSGGLTLAAFTAAGDDMEPPTVPTDLSGTAGSGSYTLTWEPSTDNVQVTGYRVHVQGGQVHALGSDDTFTINGLPDLTAHTFRVSALDAAGNESPLSTPHTGNSGDGTPPVAGTLSVDKIGNTFADLSFSGFSDNSGTIANYFVFVDEEQKLELPGTANSFTIGDLQLGATHNIHVEAVDPSSNDVRSNTVEITTTQTIDEDPPSVAPVATVASRDFESIALSWSPAEDSNGIANYAIYLLDPPNADILVADLSGNQLQYTLTGLRAGTDHDIRVVASDPSNNSISSAVISVATTAAPGYTAVDLSDENYVYTRTFQVGKTDQTDIARKKDVIEDIVYLDGLGRARQQIAIKQGADDMDIITPMEYDPLGRQQFQYLPYTGQGARGGLQGTDGAKQDGEGYYTSRYAADLDSGAPNAHSQVLYEESPLNRPLKQAAPGESWKMGNGHEIEFAYRANTDADQVPYFEVDLSAGDDRPALSTTAPGTYEVGELTRTITYDENHGSGKDHSTEEFTDKLGRVVLKRTYDNEVPHDTHYIYDDHNNLTFVLPPKVDTSDGVSAVELDELGYQYRYDHRNRLIEKKVPGKGWEHIVYNKLDQPILTQDPNLRARGRWLFTKYDAFGRVAYTGFYDSALGRSDLQDNANGHTVQFENRTTTFLDLGGAEVNYTNAAFPTDDITQLLTIGYYDSYGFRGAPGLPARGALGTPLISGSEVRGLPTGGRVRVLGTDHWVTTLTGYDEKRRPVHVRSENTYLDALDIVDSKLDFLGRAEQVKSVHTKDGNDPIETIDTFTYDNTGRVLTHLQDLNGKREAIVRNEYDPMGLLVNKKVGGSLTSPLQDVDLSYNIRGWLTGINAPDLRTTSTGANRLFAFGIHYDRSVNGSDPLFNGNIGSTEWRTKNISRKRRYYRYTYDALNRITKALDASGRFYVGSNGKPISYDKNGNILSLYRKGATSENPIDVQNLGYGTMDDLTYTYGPGNKLLGVKDNGNDNYGFIDGNTNGDDYEYDDNGNLTLDRNKGINRIEYNYLNLPTQVSVSGNGNVGIIDYIYTADGTKIEKIVSEGSSLTATEYCGNYIYERTGTNAAQLRFFSQPEGYIEPVHTDGEISSFAYVYQYKDHLGNIRLSYSDENGDGSVTSSEIREENNYYPFGMKHRGYNNQQNGRDHNYGFQGEEETEELGKNTIDYQWRDYDPAIGRFNRIDRFAEKYQLLTPYHFTSNNPIYFREIAGDSIDVSNVQRKNPDGLETLDNELETITGLALNADSGNLEYKTERGFLGIRRAKVSRDENGNKIGSRKARRRLKRAIKNKKTVKVLDNSNLGILGSMGVPKSNKSKMYFNFNLVNFLQDNLSHDLNPLTIGAGMSFLHELDHTVVGKRIDDESDDSTLYPGPTVRRTNQIRKQLGNDYGQRSAYDPTEVDGINYMPFSSNTLKQIKKGIKPTIQYLKL